MQQVSDRMEIYTKLLLRRLFFSDILTLENEDIMLPRNVRFWLYINAASYLRRTHSSAAWLSELHWKLLLLED